MDLRAEIEAIFARVHEAVARKDVRAARDVVLSPSWLHDDSFALFPSPGAHLVGMVETDERWVVCGVVIDGRRWGMRDAAAFLRFFRGRDGVLRLEPTFTATEASSSSPSDLAVAWAQGLELHRTPPHARTRVRRWSPPPARPTPVAAIRWLGPPDAGVAPSEVDAAERALGVSLPAGYREYVTRFGAAVECNLVRVYPPQRVLAELEEWRSRVDAYWLWAPSGEGLDRDRAQRCVVIGDTLSGDEIVLDPERPSALFVLPRHADEVVRVPGDLTHLLAWLCESGDLVAPCPTRYATPLEGQERRMYEPTNDAGDEDEWLEEAREIHDALVALDRGATSIAHDDEDGGWTVLLPSLRGTAFVFANGGASVSADPNAFAMLARIDRELTARGLERR